MSHVVIHTTDHRGMTSSRCPACNTLYVYWDEDDLDENGDLLCHCDDEAEEATYSIVRFRFQGENEVIRSGLTLEEAQEHCQDETTHGDGWFDGYKED